MSANRATDSSTISNYYNISLIPQEQDREGGGVEQEEEEEEEFLRINIAIFERRGSYRYQANLLGSDSILICLRAALVGFEKHPGLSIQEEPFYPNGLTPGQIFQCRPRSMNTKPYKISRELPR